MVPAAPAVNSTIKDKGQYHALIWRVQCAMRRASVGAYRLVMQRNERCVQMHNSPNRERYLASTAYRAKFTVPVATGAVRQSSFSLELGFAGLDRDFRA
jgi:hypothetical protein